EYKTAATLESFFLFLRDSVQLDVESPAVTSCKKCITSLGVLCHSVCRTRWFDHDDPTGNGDYEVLSDLLTMYPREICPQSDGDKVVHLSVGALFSVSCSYDATYGFACVNADQGSRSCEDYRVRFTCPEEFCQEQCRTRWMNSDTPSEEGDVESILQLMKTFPGQACKNPVSIEAKTTRGISAAHTGDTYLSYDVTFGFACINKKQKSKQCEDYQVILTCPSDFCQGKFSCR
uniref:WxxW domain-containing protein n=1 Tax=Seriola dumerili TaxID=41447 RepID=A0A3B4TEU8_SERDU